MFELAGRFATRATVPLRLIDVPAVPVLPVAPVAPVGPATVLVGPVDPVAPVGPVTPCFSVNSNIAAEDVPTFVTEGVPVGPVVKVFQQQLLLLRP